MEIFEKETVLIWTGNNTEYVITKTLCNINYYVSLSFIFKGKDYKSMNDDRNYKNYLIDGTISIITHPCPKDIRENIIKMLNSREIDTINYAEAILKTY